MIYIKFCEISSLSLISFVSLVSLVMSSNSCACDKISETFSTCFYKSSHYCFCRCGDTSKPVCGFCRAAYTQTFTNERILCLVIMRMINENEALDKRFSGNIGTQRIKCLQTLFAFIDVNQHFLKAHPTFKNTVAAKIDETKTQPYLQTFSRRVEHLNYINQKRKGRLPQRYIDHC